jgi:23S rRNA pseudouridine1911/1915/1917 synthase
MRLDAYLSQYLPEHSRSEWRRLIEVGGVVVNGGEAKPATRLTGGDRLAIEPIAPHALLEPDPTIHVDVLYQDRAIVVVNKPPGLVVHPAPGNETGTLVHGLLARFPELLDPTGQLRPGIAHRLDKDTSGVMVVGKTPAAVADLQRQMQAGDTRKRYRLLVHGTIEEDAGVIDAPIARDRFNRQRMAVRADGRSARTEFRVLERLPGYTYVDAGLVSGRTHQLRVHFAYIGHPVAGDRTYGRRRSPQGLDRQFVHSRELTLKSPAVKEAHTFVAEIPEELEQVIERLRPHPNPLPEGEGADLVPLPLGEAGDAPQARAG